jgi:hypothetical protein
VSGRAKGEFVAKVCPFSLTFFALPAFGSSEVSTRLFDADTYARFPPQDDAELIVPLTFVPLAPSALFLPSVAITPLSSSSSDFLTCETQHVSAATFVEVLPITHRTTFDIAVPLLAGA